jgi:glycosyltransferase involved in cell wall biosynthesis
MIPHGIDENVFFNTDAARGEAVAFVGFIAENKGANLLPDIFSRIARARDAAKFAIVGYGPLQESIAGEFQKQGIGEKVDFTGKLAPVEVASVLRRSRVLILPTQLEGFGLAIAEAMMCGVVPVVTRLSGVTDDLIRHGDNGFLVDSGDVGGFASAANRLLHDDALWQRMSNDACTTALERFANTTMIRVYETVFDQADHRRSSSKRNVLGWAFDTSVDVAVGKLAKLGAKVFC